MSYYEGPSDLYGKSFGHGSLETPLPKLRSDLIVRQQVEKEEIFYLIKDPITMDYYKFSSHEWDILSLFDGEHTEEEIVDLHNKKHPAEIIDEDDVEFYKDDLKGLELLDIPAMEKNLMLMERIRSQRKLRLNPGRWGNLSDVILTTWNPDEFLGKIVKPLRPLWTKEFFIVSFIGVLLMLCINFVKWDEFTQGVIELYSFTDKSLWQILVFIFLMTATGTFHEFGHALTLKHYGGEIRSMGFSLFYFSPAFYVDISDSYLLPRRERMWVTFAGTYSELVVCSLASFIWFFAVPGTLLYEFSFQLILFTGFSSFLINMNPLIKLDGYFALMDVLGIPDLREESFAFLERWIKKNIFRLQVEEQEELTRRKKRIFIIYSVLAILYTLSIYLFFLLWLRNIYLESFRQVGNLLFLATLYLFFRKELFQMLSFAKFVYLDKKEVLMRRKKLLLGIAAIVAILLLLPWTHMKISGSGVIAPVKKVEIRCETDGFVRRVSAQESTVVSAGSELAVLENPDLQQQLFRSAAKLQTIDSEIARLQLQQDSVQYRMKLSARDQALSENEELQRKTAKLKLVAPSSGTILTPYLDQRVGMYYPKGGLFCEMADLSHVMLQVIVREYHIPDVQPGQKVRLKFDAYPTETFQGTVEEISSAISQRVEAVEGTYTNFRVGVTLDNQDGRLKPGMKADARILADQRSFAYRIGREVIRWVRSKIW